MEVTADMLVTLEALQGEVRAIMLAMADVETFIYGNSKDVFDNFNDVSSNTLSAEESRHTYVGLNKRITDL